MVSVQKVRWRGNTPLVARLFYVHWAGFNLLFLNGFNPWRDRFGNMTHDLNLLMMRAGIVLFFYAGITQESFDALVAFSEKC